MECGDVKDAYRGKTCRESHTGIVLHPGDFTYDDTIRKGEIVSSLMTENGQMNYTRLNQVSNIYSFPFVTQALEGKYVQMKKSI